MLCKIYKYSSKMFYTHRRGCPRLILGCLDNMIIKTFIKQMDSSRGHYRSNDKKIKPFCILSALRNGRVDARQISILYFLGYFSLEYIF